MIIKRIFAILVVIIIIMACLPISAFAEPVLDTDTIQQFGVIIVDISGMADNVNMSYDLTTNESAITVVQDLYQTYASETGDPYTLAAISAAALVGGAIAVIYDAVTGQGYIQLYQEQYISSLDGYWDYQLTDLGFVRDSLTDLFNWSETNGNVYPVPVFNGYSTTINGYTVHYLPIQYTSKSYFDSPDNDVFEFYAERSNGQYGVVYIASFSPNRTYAIYQQGQPEPTQQSMSLSETRGDITLYFGYQTSSSGNLLNVDFVNSLAYSDLRYPLSNLFGVNANNADGAVITDIEQISIEPSVYTGDTLLNPLEITVPDVSDQNYVPEPKIITTNIPWDTQAWGNPLPEGVTTPEYGVSYPVTDPDILNNLVPDLYEELIDGNISIQDAPAPVDPVVPNEVYVPFLPVALPNFNFSLSGIWHYVREWIASLGAWFTMVLNVWSNLPYAMVVPVYATMVVLIVLGVYKRFFM